MMSIFALIALLTFETTLFNLCIFACVLCTMVARNFQHKCFKL